MRRILIFAIVRFAAFAVPVALTIRDTDAAATMVPRQHQPPDRQDKDPAPFAKARPDHPLTAGRQDPDR